MRFMFFGPEVCLGLPSDSASPRTPLPPTTATAAFTAQDLHLVDNAHAGHTKTGERLKCLSPVFIGLGENLSADFPFPFHVL